jgi:DNA (cytosine-5)-methyltransferase 1
LIPDHDILAGGFPCQPFSHAGVSARSAVGKDHGFKCETQGTLFFDVVRIAQVKKPKFLFLENVRNIERHDDGRTFDVIKRAIAEIGYKFHYALIDSSTLVPQRRIRCYMVCVRNDVTCDFKFPDFTGTPLPLKSILESNVPEVYTISDRLWEGHINRTRRNLERGTGFTAFLADLSRPANTLVARYGKDGKECLIPQDGKNPRMLTPRECARLQGYPENFILPKARTPAYKQFGNSVSVPVIRKIAKSIIENLL